MTAQEKITKARAGLILDQPFFGSLALRLRPQADGTCPTAWTDGISLGYNPAWIESLPLDQVKGVIAHEVMHCSNGHHCRRQQREPRAWNIATDGAINEVLESADFVLPKGAIRQPTMAGQSAEERYSKLPQGGGQGQPQAGQGEPWQIGEVRDCPAPQGSSAASSADMNAQAQTWKIATAQAAQAARRAGKLGGELGRMVNDIINPLLPWRDILRRFVENTAKADYSWIIPNRRFIWQGLYLPSCISENMRPLVLVMDTSGSTWCEPQLLEQFAAEISAIVQDCGANIKLIYADSRINKIEDYTPEDMPLKLKVHGGGGTDFRPAIAHVENLPDEIAALIYFTDLEGHFPDHEPAFPVLWITNDESGKVPFGEVLVIKRRGGRSSCHQQLLRAAPYSLIH